MRYVLGDSEKYDIDGEMTEKTIDLTEHLTEF